MSSSTSDILPKMSSVIDRDLPFLVLQYLRERNSEAAQMLEDELREANGNDFRFPEVPHARLRELMIHSVSWQTWSRNEIYDNPRLETLFVDVVLRKQSTFINILKPIEKYKEISKKSEVCCLTIPPFPGMDSRISKLTYTNSGDTLLALASNGLHYMWKWEQKATASVLPRLLQPSEGRMMMNYMTDTNPEEAVSCFALSEDDSFIISTSGQDVSFFELGSFVKTTLLTSPAAATVIAIHPQNNDIVAVGMEDSVINIYDVKKNKVIRKLEGHHFNRITGLAFSRLLDVLVSSAADARLCVWGTKGWKMQKSEVLLAAHADTCVQFYPDQIQFLVVHKSKLSVYEVKNLDLLHQRDSFASALAPLSSATFSGDGQWVFGCYEDGSIGIFTAAYLTLQCRLTGLAYQVVPSIPTFITAHPEEATQFALGMEDGTIYVLKMSGAWHGGNGGKPGSRLGI